MGCILCQGDEEQSSSPKLVQAKRIAPFKQPQIVDLNESFRSGTTVSQQPVQVQPDKIRRIRDAAPSQQKRMITQYVKDNITKKTKKYFLVEYQWTQKFTTFLRSQKPQFKVPVNNRQLLDNSGRIKRGLQRNKHYVILNDIVYSLIKELFYVNMQLSSDQLGLRSTLRPIGLANNRYLCYLNSGLQLLLTVPQFVDYFHHQRYQDAVLPRKTNFFSQGTSRLMKQLSSPGKSVKNPQFFTKLLLDQFSDCQQHDCQQFLNFYFGRLQNQLNQQSPFKITNSTSNQQAIQYQSYSTLNSCIVDKLFTIFTQNRISCRLCRKPRKKFQAHLYLSLSLIKDMSIQQAIRQLISEQIIDDPLTCDYCKQVSKQATIRLTLTRLPKYLLLYMKRYKITGKKTYYQLRFDSKLQLGQILQTKGRFLYQLIGIVVHKGKSTAGHYVTYIKRGDRWFCCDDDRVTQKTTQQVLYQQPYMLLYKNKS